MRVVLGSALDGADKFSGAAAAATADWKARTDAAIKDRQTDTESLEEYASFFRSQAKTNEQLRQRPAFEVSDDLLDDRVRPVRPVRSFGLEHRQWAVGEHRVILVGGERLALIVRVHVFDPAHDQPGRNVLGLGP